MAYSIADSMGYLAMFTNKLIGKRLLHYFKQNDLSIGTDQWMALVSLYERNAQSQQELGEFSGKDKAGVTRVVDSLENQGYVERQTDKNDRRVNRIHITAKGRAFTEKLIAFAEQALGDAYDGLSADELEQCKNTLRRINENLLAKLD